MRQEETEIIVEHDVPKERTLTGFLILLGSVAAFLGLTLVFFEYYDTTPPEPKTKAKYEVYILPSGLDTFFNQEREPWPFGIKPEN